MKKYDKSKFLWLAKKIHHFFFKIQPIISEQEKKRQRIYDLLNAESKPKRISKVIGVSLWPASSPDLTPLDYVIWEVLENKTNATSLLNIGSLKTASAEEWNKISEEFILKACKLFWRCVDTIIEKIVAILSKFTILCLFSYFVVYFSKLKLILFYNRVVYYYTRIFLNLLPYPVDTLKCISSIDLLYRYYIQINQS